jgi:hypothetical protein
MMAKRLCGLTVVILQQTTESLMTVNDPLMIIGRLA